jgi:hypothetical protein
MATVSRLGASPCFFDGALVVVDAAATALQSRGTASWRAERKRRHLHGERYVWSASTKVTGEGVECGTWTAPAEAI